MGEFLARIRAVMRRIVGVDEQSVMHFEDLTLDLLHRRVTREDHEIKLTLTEYEIVKNLAINAGIVMTHNNILRSVWGPSSKKEIQYLRVYIGQIRRKLELDPSRPRHIITDTGVGYRLI